MTNVIGVLVALVGITAFVGLVVLNTRPLPDQPAHPAELPAPRPGRDDQWIAFRETVPNIRKAALEEAALEELAWHPASLDEPDLAGPFRWFPEPAMSNNTKEN